MRARRLPCPPVAALAIVAGLLALGTPRAAAVAAAPSAWQPEAPGYDVFEQDNVPITVTDENPADDPGGTITLRANVGLPAARGTADPLTGRAPHPLAGPFPVLVSQTPYRKDGGLFGVDPYFVSRGYAFVIVDVRGTGSSEGRWDSFGAEEQHDGPQVVRWAAHQPWANGSVGLTGPSYLAINQLLTMEQPDAPAEVKAIFPVVPMSDAYRDVTYHGGNLDAAFIPPWLGLVTGLGAPPGNQSFDGSPQDFRDGLAVMAEHGYNVTQFQAPSVVAATAQGTTFSYDGPFSVLRSPLWRIDRVHVPTFIVGGEFDIFQRGEPLLYNALDAPAKRLLIGPWIHIQGSTASTLPADGIPDLHTLELQWFDQYVRGEDTGEDAEPRVLQYELRGTDASHFMASDTWPLHAVRPVDLYLDGTASGSAHSLNDGSLSTTAPAASGNDPLPYTPGTGCSRTTFQWGDASAGVVGASQAPCETDERVTEAGSLTYSTPVLTQPVTINGPINAHVIAENPMARDIIFTVRVTDVAPDGTSTQLSAGWLQASLRAATAQPAVTLAEQGTLLRVFHPFTPDSVQDPPPGPTGYDVEVFPTFATFPPGHRIRVDIASGDTPHLLPSAPHQTEVTGAVFLVDRGGAADHASYVSLPVITDANRPCGICAVAATGPTGAVQAASASGTPNTSTPTPPAAAALAGLLPLAAGARLLRRRRRATDVIRGSRRR